MAMADGKVLTAIYNSSYGNMVMLDHRQRHCNSLCTRLTDISQNESNCQTRTISFKSTVQLAIQQVHMHISR